jgi:transcription elongation factor Elf1
VWHVQGKKTSKRKPPPKRVMEKLERVFTCPFCNHEKACVVEMLVF